MGTRSAQSEEGGAGELPGQWAQELSPQTIASRSEMRVRYVVHKGGNKAELALATSSRSRRQSARWLH